MPADFLNTILDSVERNIDDKLTKVTKTMDKTYIAQIVGKEYSDGKYLYKVIASGTEYQVKDVNSYDVGKKVIVRIPMGNLTNIYIDKEYGAKVESGSGGGDIEWVKY